jgi:hypothetical protein
MGTLWGNLKELYEVAGFARNVAMRYKEWSEKLDSNTS